MSRVIRGIGSPPRVVPGEVVDARAEAERIVQEARDEAARLLREAHAEAERVRERARAEGLAAGREEAAAVLVAAAVARDQAIASAERSVQTLALVAAGRIVGAEVTLAPERIAGIVADVVARARRATQVEVFVHPDDAAVLEQHRPLVPARIVADPSITRGGCILRSELGEVDARVEVQLEAMAKILGCTSP